MSYKALYRTYRPLNFNEVIGQDHITSTLQNIISNDKIGHAYLFAGPRGTGKTSVAHVFARAVNVNAAGEEVFADMDIIEIDAASNNGVSEVRQIIDNVNYAPTKAKYKVYIIDEVHMLTKGAFNALLKTLEEPPAHVIFVLATTEPHKIPITILSRTQRFNFKRIDDVTIGKQLFKVLTKEGIKFDDEAIKFISKLAQGGMRDALSIADQSSAFGNGVVSFEAISQVFGIISIDNQIKLFNMAYVGDAKGLMTLISEMLNNGADIERLSSSLLDVLKDFIVLKKTMDVNLLSFISKEDVEALNMDVNYAYEVVDVMIKLITELRFTSVPRQSFELAILKIAKNNGQVNVEEVKVQPEVKTFTQEIRDEKDETVNIFDDTQELPTKKETMEEIEADQEINIDVVNEETQVMDEQSELEDDILSTQEIPMGEIKAEEVTAEIDIMKLFETGNGTKVKTPSSNKVTSVDEILNLLVQADRNALNVSKENWLKAQSFINDGTYKHFAELITNSAIIASGHNFVLVSAQEQWVIDGINSEKSGQNFIRFIKELTGAPTLVVAISKQEFNVVKESWKQLSSTDSLPTPKSIRAPTLEAIPKTEEEEFGSNLFGDLFSA